MLALAPFCRGFGVGSFGFTLADLGFALGRLAFGGFALGGFALGGFAFSRFALGAFLASGLLGFGDFGRRNRGCLFQLRRRNRLGFLDLLGGHSLFFRCLFAASQPYDQEAGENHAPYTRAPNTGKCAVDHV